MMTENNQQPNILFVIADQMTPFMTGVYGDTVAQTPNLDKLAASGIRFDSAYTPCPICAPARASMLTGRYISRIGAYDNSTPWPDEEPTFAHYLSKAGYDTVASGKMHFIGADQQHGFAKRLTTDIFPAGLGWTTSRQEKTAFSDIHSQPIAIDYVTAGVRQWSMQFEFDEEVQFRALQYLHSRRMQVGGTMQKPQKQRNSQPFCLCVSYSHPHEPFHPTQELWDRYDNAKIDIPQFPENMSETYSKMDVWLNAFHGVHRVDLKNEKNLYNLRRSYYALVSYVDDKVGELIKCLEETGLADNTIVIFTSDHGDMLGEKGMIQKRCFYERSSRVPLIIKYPDKHFKGRVETRHCSLVDLAPTVLDMAGIPDKERLSLDGQSLTGPTGSGNSGDNNDRAVFSELHTEGVYTPCFMMREGQFKYIYIHNNACQLFNTEHDPKEWKNLSGNPDYAELEDHMKCRILEKFDPDAIDIAVTKSLAKRTLVRDAMKAANISWDFSPYFDATRQYWREG